MKDYPSSGDQPSGRFNKPDHSSNRDRDRSYGGNNSRPTNNKFPPKSPDHHRDNRDFGGKKPFNNRDSGDRYNSNSRPRDDRPRFDRREGGNNDRPRSDHREGGDRPRFDRREGGDRPRFDRREGGDRPRFERREGGDNRDFNKDKQHQDDSIPLDESRPFRAPKPNARAQSFDEYNDNIEQFRDKERHREEKAKEKLQKHQESKAPVQLDIDITPEQRKEFESQRKKLDEFYTTAYYAPYIGIPDKIPTYKPFINAVHNLGGITHKQLYQLHLYTQCLLASQRHKFDLNSFDDGYYNNSIFPPVPDYFPILNVTALRQPDLIFNQHLADALSIIPTIEAHIPQLSTPHVKSFLSQGLAADNVPVKIVDVGSGGGIPSIILAIMRPTWQITAIDTVGKKCNFLRHTADRLGLGNFTVVSGSSSLYANPLLPVLATALKSIPQYANKLAQEREDNLSFSMYEAYDICVARGVTQMPQLLPICMPLIHPGGKFIAMKSLLSSIPRSERDEILDTATRTQASITTDAKPNSIFEFLADSTSTGLEVDGELLDQVEKQQKQETEEAKAKQNHGEAFKSAQAERIKSISNFDSVLSSVLAQPWIPMGRSNQNYLDLSIELSEAFPTLGKFGASRKQAVFIHTDLFFQVNGNESRFKKVQEQQKELSTQFAKQSLKDAFDSNDDEANTKSTKKDQQLFLPSCNQVGFTKDQSKDEKFIQAVSAQHFPQQDNLAHMKEGKVGETAKYLLVIDKITALTIEQQEPATKEERPLSKGQQLRQKFRTSSKFQFEDPLGEGQASEFTKPKGNFYDSLEGDNISFGDRKPFHKKPFHIDSSSGDKRTFNSDRKPSYGGDKSFGDNKPQRSFGAKKPFDNKKF